MAAPLFARRYRHVVMFSPQLLVIAAFTAIMIAAAVEDFQRLIIPNPLPIALCALWPVYFAAAPTLLGALAALGTALAVFLVGAVLFARGFLGGGDVKLLSAATLWAGPAGTPALLILTGVLGGALALFLLVPFGRQIMTAGRGLMGQPPLDAESAMATPVPYGIAIAVAALIVILPRSFG